MKIIKLYHLPLNLDQGIIHTNQSDVCNTIIAFYSKHKQKMIVRPEYSKFVETINNRFPFTNLFRIDFGDAFSIDTWDEKMFG